MSERIGKKRHAKGTHKPYVAERGSRNWVYCTWDPSVEMYRDSNSYPSKRMAQMMLAEHKRGSAYGGKKRRGSALAPAHSTCSRCGKKMLFSKSVTGWDPVKGMVTLMHARCARGAGRYPKKDIVGKLVTQVKALLK